MVLMSSTDSMTNCFSGRTSSKIITRSSGGSLAKSPKGDDAVALMLAAFSAERSVSEGIVERGCTEMGEEILLERKFLVKTPVTPAKKLLPR